jgi:hypothetical protein
VAGRVGTVAGVVGAAVGGTAVAAVVELDAGTVLVDDGATVDVVVEVVEVDVVVDVEVAPDDVRPTESEKDVSDVGRSINSLITSATSASQPLDATTPGTLTPVAVSTPAGGSPARADPPGFDVDSATETVPPRPQVVDSAGTEMLTESVRAIDAWPVVGSIDPVAGAASVRVMSACGPDTAPRSNVGIEV